MECEATPHITLDFVRQVIIFMKSLYYVHFFDIRQRSEPKKTNARENPCESPVSFSAPDFSGLGKRHSMHKL